jgi:hypothetical protein
MENKQEALDEDIAMRTVALFRAGMEREEACNLLSVPVFQEESWDAFWDAMQEDEKIDAEVDSAED